MVIAYEQTSEGFVVLLVVGASGIRSHLMLTIRAARLALYFGVINYDRRHLA